MKKKIRDTQQAWDKSTLGAEAQFVAIADSQHELNLNAVEFNLQVHL